MKRRAIPREIVQSVLEKPQQDVPERGEKKAYQSRLDFGGGKVFLLRVIIVDNVDPAIVVTVYRTTRVNKCWRTE